MGEGWQISWGEVTIILWMGGGEDTGLCRLWRQPLYTGAAPSGRNNLIAHTLGRRRLSEQGEGGWKVAEV